MLGLPQSRALDTLQSLLGSIKIPVQSQNGRRLTLLNLIQCLIEAGIRFLMEVQTLFPFSVVPCSIPPGIPIPMNLKTLQLVTQSHYESLGSFLRCSNIAKESIFYSYTRHINGFSATLEEVASKIAKHPEVLSVFKNRGRKLHTTHSGGFMGLEHNGDDVIQFNLGQSQIW
ncbi:hypothetical protein VNO77_33667 [Canavalia gladiata]|uniref:Inhibitor I9 domain-containing protein n=1 Tax=Canavalia gladiata TaxID=3824 RepID=A0AAN9KCU0_CANGL